MGKYPACKLREMNALAKNNPPIKLKFINLCNKLVGSDYLV